MSLQHMQRGNLRHKKLWKQKKKKKKKKKNTEKKQKKKL